MATIIKDLKLELLGKGAYTSNQYNIEIAGKQYSITYIEIKQEVLEFGEIEIQLERTNGLNKDDQDAAMRELMGCVLSLTYSTYDPKKVRKGGYVSDPPVTLGGYVRSVDGMVNDSENCIWITCVGWGGLMETGITVNCKSYLDKTLTEIVQDMADTYCFKIDTDVSYDAKLPYTVQYNETGWQFLKRLATRYGQWLYTNPDMTLRFGKLKLDEETVDLRYPGEEVSRFYNTGKVSSMSFTHVTASYNSDENKTKDGAEEAKKSLGDLSDAVYEASLNLYKMSNYEYVHLAGGSDKDSSDAILERSTKTMARGLKIGAVEYHINTTNSQLAIGRVVTVTEVYKRSNKQSNQSAPIRIVALTTKIGGDRSFEVNAVGMNAEGDYPWYGDTGAYPKCPPCRAKVIENEDSEHLGRIVVQFPWQAVQDPDMKTPWLRMVQPYAGGDKGMCFIPEVGEEVMVDFEGGNGERPFVIGTMFNGKGKLDEAWTENSNADNRVKAIRTRNGHTIEFHDDGEDGEGFIRIYDKKKENYSITLNASTNTIMIETKGDVEVVAEQDIRMHAKHDIHLEADNDFEIMAHKGIYSLADGDHKQTVKGEHEVNVQKNQKITVEQNQSIEVKNNFELEVKNQIDEKASSIRVEGQQEIKESAPNVSIKADSSYGVSSNGTVDIKGNMTKIN